jgi:hypothetical protein
MTFEKQYTTAGTYTVTMSANWTGVSSSGQFSGYATTTGTIQVLTNCNPVITAGPSNETVLAGSTAQFSVSVTSPYPASFQWYFNHTFPVIGPILSTLTLPDVETNEAGLYSVVVSNVYGSVTSAVASLTVLNPIVSGIKLNTNGSISLTFMGLSNSTSRVEATTNLALPAGWQAIYTNISTGTNTVWQFTDTNAGNYQQRFYRFSTP